MIPSSPDLPGPSKGPEVRVLCITDPGTHPPFDTTVGLYHLLPADDRFELWHLNVSRVGDGRAFPAVGVPSPLDYPGFQALAEAPGLPREFPDMDLVWVRADRPYPPGFLETLARFEDRVRFVARPSAMHQCDTRVFCRQLAAKHMAIGLVTREPGEALEFLRDHGRIVAKRNRGYGGKQVSRIWPEQGRWWLQTGRGIPQSHRDPEALLTMLLRSDDEPYELVEFLDRAVEGDKRVLVTEGQVLGAFLRIPPAGSWIGNLTSGGSAAPATVRDEEHAVIADTWEAYHARGLDLLGYDFLIGNDGRWVLSEINASGNIAGYREAEMTSSVPVFPQLLDWAHQRASRAP